MAAPDDSFPMVNVADPQDERAIVKLIRFLETRIQRRDELQKDAQNHFRNILVKLEHENALLTYDNNEQKKIISTLEGRICKLQNHIDGLLSKLNNACDAMRSIQEELKDRSQQHTLEKQKIIQKYNVMIRAETDRMTKEMETKLQEQHERLTNCIKKKDDKLRLVSQILTSTREDASDNVALTSPIASSSRIETAEKSKSKKEIFVMTPIDPSRSPRHIRQTSSSRTRTIPNDTHEKASEKPSPLSKEKPPVTFVDSQISVSRDPIRQISSHVRINSNGIQRKTAKEPLLMTLAESSVPSDLKTESIEESDPTTSVDSPSSSMIVSTDTTVIMKTKLNARDKIPVVNPRYQRVQNADRWIDHRPARIVPTGTILQPQTQLHKRTIRKLTNPKDFMARSSRYCLLSQEQDTDGELETKLYKADVLPTCGGGAQIIFNDVECLKQISPIAKHNGQIKLENNPVNTS